MTLKHPAAPNDPTNYFMLTINRRSSDLFLIDSSKFPFLPIFSPAVYKIHDSISYLTYNSRKYEFRIILNFFRLGF